MQTSPWSNISGSSPGRLSVIRVETGATWQMFWFRDTDESVGLLIEIHPATSAAMLREANISIRDVMIDIRHLSDRGILALALRLRDANKSDIFLRLCLDLIDRVNNSTDNDRIFSMMCQRLKKWQSLFAGRTSSLLTANEVQGLFAELCFLHELLDSGVISQEQAIRSWKGPERSQQDFVLNDTAVEIKSLTGKNRSKVRISSEDQLYSPLSLLFLRVYLLAEIYETSGGEDLNSLVRSISAKLTEESTKDNFETLLQMAGYIDLPEYDQPQFMVKNCYTYLVSDHFPRIIQQTLPAGIQAVSYDVLLGAIEPFRVTEVKILEQ